MNVAGMITQQSDIRLKKSIKILENNVLSKLKNIKPIYFEWMDKNMREDGIHLGVIAQEVEKEFPSLVRKDVSGYLSVDYGRLSAVLIQALNEQEIREEEQEKKYEEQMKQLKSDLKEQGMKHEEHISKLNLELKELKDQFQKLSRTQLYCTTMFELFC